MSNYFHDLTIEEKEETGTMTFLYRYNNLNKIQKSKLRLSASIIIKIHESWYRYSLAKATWHENLCRLCKDEYKRWNIKKIQQRWLLTFELGAKDFITHLAPKRNASLSGVMHASTWPSLFNWAQSASASPLAFSTGIPSSLASSYHQLTRNYKKKLCKRITNKTKMKNPNPQLESK
jgi:hypothetical protein